MDSGGGVRWYCEPILSDARWLHWCSNVLSANELIRACTYSREPAATCFRSGHGALRLWLGRQLDIAPGALVFTTSGEAGKPVLDPPQHAFSFSHTETRPVCSAP